MEPIIYCFKWWALGLLALPVFNVRLRSTKRLALVATGPLNTASIVHWQHNNVRLVALRDCVRNPPQIRCGAVRPAISLPASPHPIRLALVPHWPNARAARPINCWGLHWWLAVWKHLHNSNTCFSECWKDDKQVSLSCPCVCGAMPFEHHRCTGQKKHRDHISIYGEATGALQAVILSDSQTQRADSCCKAPTLHLTVDCEPGMWALPTPKRIPHIKWRHFTKVSHNRGRLARASDL